MHTIDLDDNWKQAASQESVDYQAVESTFMTQAYGFVANKAKVLFRDPFRLGFEIVHRNEKATKMVGIFAFRCNNSLLYAPVFFVNGEIKGADMLYRSEVKRFVPLSDEWCSFLVRGANEEAGSAQRRDSIRRQPDANMYRLAYPHRTKYAAEDGGVDLEKLASYAFELIEQAKRESPEDPKAWLEAKAEAEPDLALDVAKALNEGGFEEKPNVGRTIGRTLTGTLGGVAGLAAGGLGAAGAEALNAGAGSSINPIVLKAIQGALMGGGMLGGAHLGRELIDKSASEDIFMDLMRHCSQDEAPLPRLIPRAIKDGGPDFLVKLANLIEGSEIASRYLAENYTTADLTLDPDWCVKKAAEAAAAIDPMERYRNSVILVRELGFAKSAHDRKGIANHGYAMEDYRELGAVNATVDIAEDPTIHEISSPGVVSVMDSDGGQFDALLLHPEEQWMSDRGDNRGAPSIAGDSDYGQRVLITLDGKAAEYLSYHGRRNDRLIGKYKEDKSCLDKCCIKPSAAKVGKVYVLVCKESLHASEPFVVSDKRGKVMSTTSLYGSLRADLVFKSDATDADPNRGFINDNFALIELKTKKDEGHGSDYLKPVWDKSLMAPAQLNAWLRTGGGTTHSKDITVTKEPSGLFTVSADGSDGFRKVARSLDRMAAHLNLVGDYEMRVDKSGEILDCAQDKGVTRFRLFDTVSKSGYVTRMNPEQEWISGYDPVLNARMQFPQEQTLGTTTPERPQQHHRIGDRYMGEAPQAHYDEEDDGLPADALMGQSPEELASMAQKYDMPQIFDHQVIGSLAGNTYDTIEQVRQYVPDLETGVDRYARILFLLRYRPADFEEAYGKDELMEMEQELSSLFAMAGKTLLRMLKRFDTDKFSPQSDS